MIKASELKLVSKDDVILHQRLPEYDFATEGEDAPFFANMLFKKMQDLGGIGLSACQVGINKRVFVIGVDEFKMYVFNPEIVGYSIETEHMTEGCLSFPGLSLGINRPKTIDVKYQNEQGEYISVTLGGITARAFQHEYDHMEGRLFTSHVTPFKLEYYTKKQEKKKAKLVKKYSQKILRDIVNGRLE